MSQDNNQSAAATPEVVEQELDTSKSTEVLETTKESEPKEPTAKEEKALKKRLRELTLKVDGKEIVEKLPFEIEDDEETVEYMRRQLQMAKMGHARSQQFSQLDKEVKAFIHELKTNPKAILSDPGIGLDLKKFASEIIEAEIANSKKSPEQLEKESLEDEIRKIKAEREKEKEDLQAKQLELLQKQEFDRYDREVSEALSGSDLPKSPYVVKKIADYMILAVEKGVDVSVKELLPIVREEIHRDIKEMFGVMPEEVIEGLVGKDTIGKLRKRSVAKAKEVPAVPLSKAVPDVGKTASEKKQDKKLTYSEFFRNNK